MRVPEWLIAALTAMGMSMVPIIELKGAIPVGMAMGLSLWPAFLAALAGSCLPAIPILFFFKPIMAYLRRSKPLRWMARYAERKAHKNIGRVLRSKYIYWGLFAFVAIPLPGTGVWTGSLIASFLGLRIQYALPVIVLGNASAGFFILMLSHMIF